MRQKKQTLIPKFQKIFEQMGENIKLARKRHNQTTILGACRTSIFQI